MSIEPSGKYLKHLESMKDGASVYLKWYETALFNGIISFQDHSEDIDILASRMVDYRMGNIAKRLRTHIEKGLNDADAMQAFQYLLNDIALLARAILKFKELEGQLQWSVLTSTGLKIRSADLHNIGSRFDETCSVLGQEYTIEENVHVVKTWFVNEKTQFYYQLEYAFNREVNSPYNLGQSYELDGYTYPTAENERIYINHQDKSNKDCISAIESPDEINKYLRKQYNIQPFLRKIPLLLPCSSIVWHQKSLYASTVSGDAVKISADKQLMDITQGMEEIKLFGYWYRYSFYPLSLIADGKALKLEKLYVDKR